MNNLKSIKSVSGKVKDITLTIVLVSSLFGVALSSNANAATQNNINEEVGAFVSEQGQQVLLELNAELQQSITTQIEAFNVNYELERATLWLTEGPKTQSLDPLNANQSHETVSYTNTTKYTK